MTPQMIQLFLSVDPVLQNLDLKFMPPGSLEDEAIEATRDAEILLGDYTHRTKISRRVIESAPDLKFIQQIAVGVEIIDLEAARERGIPVANIAGFNSIGLGEHAMMLILSLLKKTPSMHMETSRCNWLQVQVVGQGSAWELSSRTLGIVGMGSSGTELAKRARAFTPSILYHKRNRLSAAEEASLGVNYASFDELLRKSDVISIHVPLTDETKGMFGRETIAKMKKNAILVNVARGEIVDAQAVADAIKEGRLAGAGIDVFNPEPIKPDNPLISLPNVILTPHIAGATAECAQRGVIYLGQNVARYLKGERPINIVNGL